MFMAAATTNYQQKTHHRHQDTISTNLTLQVITSILNILIIEPIMVVVVVVVVAVVSGRW